MCQTDLALLLGANRFYKAGIYGQGARAAVIEGEHVWNGDASTAHVSDYYVKLPGRIVSVMSVTSGIGTRPGRAVCWVGAALQRREPELPHRSAFPPVTATRWSGVAYEFLVTNCDDGTRPRPFYARESRRCNQ